VNKAEQLIEKLDSIDEALKPADKKVVDSFYNKEENHKGKMLDTDGKVLDKMGMGSETVVKWNGHVIEVVGSMSSNSDDMILRYIKKSFPKNRLGNLTDYI